LPCHPCKLTGDDKGQQPARDRAARARDCIRKRRLQAIDVTNEQRQHGQRERPCKEAVRTEQMPAARRDVDDAPQSDRQ
jgi:hypothetical protein